MPCHKQLMQIIHQEESHPMTLGPLEWGFGKLINPYVFKKMPSNKRGHVKNNFYLSDHVGIGCTNVAEAHLVGATTLFEHTSPSHLT